MSKTYDDPNGYLERLKPMYTRLFRVAHAVVGNLELSEYVLKSAIVEAYLRRGEWQGRMGFQESLLHTVRTVALVELKGMRQAGTFESDWTFPMPTHIEDAHMNLLLNRISREPEAVLRIALLYYGCDFTLKQIAVIMEMRLADVQSRIRKLSSRITRAMKIRARQGSMSFEERMVSLMTEVLLTPGEDVAEMGVVFRSFERDVEGAQRPRTSVWRFVDVGLRVIAVLFLVVVFWLIAVLMQPTGPMRMPPENEPSVTFSVPVGHLTEQMAL